jgi:hypothetical protein
VERKKIESGIRESEDKIDLATAKEKRIRYSREEKNYAEEN